MKRVFEVGFAMVLILYSAFALSWFAKYNSGITVVASEQITASSVDLVAIPEVTITNSAEDQLLSRINFYRTANGLKALGKNTQLCESALAKADDMSAKDYYGHSSPSGELFDVFIPKELTYKTAAENLALVNNGPETSIELWQASPSHNQTMLGDYTHACTAFSAMPSTIYGEDVLVPIAVVGHFAKLE